MTKDEAITILKTMKNSTTYGIHTCDALGMGIKALEEPTLAAGREPTLTPPVEPVRCHQCQNNPNRGTEKAPFCCAFLMGGIDEDNYCSYAVLDETIPERKENNNGET